MLSRRVLPGDLFAIRQIDEAEILKDCANESSAMGLDKQRVKQPPGCRGLGDGRCSSDRLVERLDLVLPIHAPTLSATSPLN